MYQTAILLATGFEEVEALAAVDLLRRAEIGCDLIALEEIPAVCGRSGITVTADLPMSQADFDRYDGLILPGGVAGTKALAGDERVLELLRRFHAEGRLTAAICAAPWVLARAGLLEGRPAACHPGWESQLTGARLCRDSVVTDGTVITSRALGTAFPFGLAIVRYFLGEEQARNLARSIVYET